MTVEVVRIEGSCNSCLYAPILVQARETFEQQPNEGLYALAAKKMGVSIPPDSDIAPAPDGNIIANPNHLVNSVEKHLQEKPCDFTKSGVCELASYLIFQVSNKIIN